MYNIPIGIWLALNHPRKCPAVLVKPTPNMCVQQSSFVDQYGKVYLPYLAEWKHVCVDVRMCCMCICACLLYVCMCIKYRCACVYCIVQLPDARTTHIYVCTLHTHTQNSSDLTSLVQVMCATFADKCPVYTIQLPGHLPPQHSHCKKS